MNNDDLMNVIHGNSDISFDTLKAEADRCEYRLSIYKLIILVQTEYSNHYWDELPYTVKMNLMILSHACISRYGLGSTSGNFQLSLRHLLKIRDERQCSQFINTFTQRWNVRCHE